MDRWRLVAEDAARRAGELLARERVFQAAVAGTSRRDVKLVGDTGAEERIITRLRRDSEFAILSEEAGAIGARRDAGDLRWIVDPLDGSVNYQRGLPLSAVSIALWDGDQPRVGVVYDFARDELFSGVVGQGAWLNGAPMRVATATDEAQSVLCTGFPAATDFATEAVAGFVDQVRRYKKVRLLGSAALSLAYVAAGRADAYVERDIKLWDVAAGLALVRAAGGGAVWRGDGRTLTVFASAPGLPSLLG